MMDIKKVIENITVDVNKVADPALKATMSQLLNIVEFFAQEAERRGFTKKQLAEVLSKDPSQITRWLSAPRTGIAVRRR